MKKIPGWGTMKPLNICSVIVLILSSASFAKPHFDSHDVDWRIGDAKIKSIKYPKNHEPKFSHKDKARKSKSKHEKIVPIRNKDAKHSAASSAVLASVIDSPPVNGFVPWIAVAITDARGEDGDFMAVPGPASGSYFNDAAHNFAMGLFDTGASAHVIGYGSSVKLGLPYDYIAPSETTISGVTGSVQASVSKPIGLFAAGLGAIGPDGALDLTQLKGETNVSIAVGQDNAPLPDLATAIGSPLSVFYSTEFRNDSPITITRDGNEYTAPLITIYDKEDPAIPSYPNYIPLELRPLGASSVQYIPSMDFDEFFEFYPQSPSIITGTSAQSLFFVASVDLRDRSYSAIDKSRFMLDTGAQITVIGSRVASRLNLNPASPEFEVEIEGVTGESIMAPGFYIDGLEIPALGEWLTFTDIPVVMLDIPSPEGGSLDGIIGMNLFANANFVLHGSGFMLEPDPVLEYELIQAGTLVGDIAPAGGDGNVDFKDLAAFASCWLTGPAITGWNPDCDLAPAGGDEQVDFADFALLASHWMQ